MSHSEALCAQQMFQLQLQIVTLLPNKGRVVVILLLQDYRIIIFGTRQQFCGL